MPDQGSITATFLSDEMIGLRASLVSDAAHARWWHEGQGESVEEIEEELRRSESIPWGGNPSIRLIAVDRTAGNILAGVVVARSGNRTSRLTVTCPEGEERGRILKRVFALVLPWLFEEVGLMTGVLRVAADDRVMIDAAESAGMRLAVQLREHIRREHGRVDLLELERVNMDWGRYAR